MWNEVEQRLYWSDITERRIWREVQKSKFKNQSCGGDVLRRGNSNEILRFAQNDNRKFEVVWEGGMQVGGLVFCRDGGMLLFTDSGVFKGGAEAGELRMLYDVGLAADERFNDAIADAQGRVFAGTMRETCREGRLFRFEKGKGSVCVLEGLNISNGMGFSGDGRYFYHTDSVPGVIRRYRFDIDSGEISDGQIWCDSIQGEECPDGMTVDSEDCVWVACWGGSRVLRLDADGRVMSEVAIPAVQVSSLTFGGVEYKTLYVTSAYKGAVDVKSGRDEKGRFLGGLVYEVETDVAGRRENLADF